MICCISFLDGYSEVVIFVVFSFMGKYLVSGFGDIIVCFWDFSIEILYFICKGYRYWVFSILWFLDGKKLVLGCKNG